MCVCIQTNGYSVYAEASQEQSERVYTHIDWERKSIKYWHTSTDAADAECQAIDGRKMNDCEVIVAEVRKHEQ